MSKADHVPHFEIDAIKRNIICTLNTAAGIKRVSMSPSRARMVAQQVRAQARTYEADGPIVLTWAMLWIADGIEKELEKVANTKLQEVSDGKNIVRLVKHEGTAP